MMVERITWTETMNDVVVKRLLMGSEPQAIVARDLGVSKGAVQRQLRRLRDRMPDGVKNRYAAVTGRAPLPAFHPDTWDVLRAMISC